MEKADLTKFDLPDVPGVYIFTAGKGRGKKILYVGKATSLRDRARSYFDDDLIATRGPRIVDMVTRADGLQHETTPTVLEALVREAALIREWKPSANAMGKDDKSFLYAVITDEEIPRVLAIRGTEIDFANCTVPALELDVKHVYGPFPSGYQLREGLRLIRRIFPFFDTDRPLTLDRETNQIMLVGNKHHQARVEFNRQIGQYPRAYDRKEYQRSIRNVCLFLSGKTKQLRVMLNKDMKEAAKEERFEDAAIVRGQLFALDHIQDVSLIRDENTEKARATLVSSGARIEAYDTAHLSGTNAIGVMTVIEDGVPQKKEYRTFRIRGYAQEGMGGGKQAKRMNDDIASLKELLARRLGHPEWAMPRAIVVDGGKTHKKAAEAVLTELGIEIPVAAVVKDEKHRPREVLGSARAGITDADAVLVNSEAHRFSLALHRKARKKSLHV